MTSFIYSQSQNISSSSFSLCIWKIIIFTKKKHYIHNSFKLFTFCFCLVGLSKIVWHMCCVSIYEKFFANPYLMISFFCFVFSFAIIVVVDRHTGRKNFEENIKETKKLSLLLFQCLTAFRFTETFQRKWKRFLIISVGIIERNPRKRTRRKNACMQAFN